MTNSYVPHIHIVYYVVHVVVLDDHIDQSVDIPHDDRYYIVHIGCIARIDDADHEKIVVVSQSQMVEVTKEIHLVIDSNSR